MAKRHSHDSREYDFFGAVDKESPQLTMARFVLCVGRDDSGEEVQKIYRRKAMECHPDRHPGDTDAEARFKLLSGAYSLLTNERTREAAESEFNSALSSPFYVGRRLFCLGSLYGVRIYTPDETAAITDQARLLGSRIRYDSTAGNSKARVIYGSRSSILESSWADLMETFYGGHCLTQNAKDALGNAFMNRGHGGLDDLEWLRNNDIAVGFFMERKFLAAVNIFKAINAMIRNSIFLFRYGVCIEAMAAEPGLREREPEHWESMMRIAISVYESALADIGSRTDHWVESGNDEVLQPGSAPEAFLTVKMQLADACEEVGESAKACKLWAEILKKSPASYEAQQKALRLSTVTRKHGLMSRVRGLLTNK